MLLWRCRTLAMSCISLLFGATLYSLYADHGGARRVPVQRMPELHLDLDAYENPFNPPAKASEEGMDTGLEEDIEIDTSTNIILMKDDNYSYDRPNYYNYGEDTEDREAQSLPHDLAPLPKMPLVDKEPALVIETTSLPRSVSQFEIRSPFHFPQPHFSKPDRLLLRSDWVAELQAFLGSVPGRQVSLVTASQEHQDLVVNWLLSAHLVADPPLDNVLCLSLDEPLHLLLQGRGFSSLLVSPTRIINPMSEVTHTFSQVHIVRLTVLRLLTHYGYDVVNYDCDAILLKNPQAIFDKHKDTDVIGAFGKGPYYFFRKWGVTLNTGVMLIRSNPRVEVFWETMSGIKEPTTDDQGNINLAFHTMGLQWMNLKPKDNIDYVESEIYGLCSRAHLTVTLLPFNVICRQICMLSRREEYYVWHAVAIKDNRTVEKKMLGARAGHAWLLAENWLERSEAEPLLVGLGWLRHLVDQSMTQLGQSRT